MAQGRSFRQETILVIGGACLPCLPLFFHTRGHNSGQKVSAGSQGWKCEFIIGNNNGVLHC